jgi:predicted ArsR family transcriptional regulator
MSDRSGDFVTDDFATRVAGIGALADPARRRLYQYVAAQSEPVGRDQVAAGTGVPRHVVKFHLDKLVDEGLLETEFRRLSGRRGPGAGRPAKLYRRAARELSVTLPERQYELVGQILADAVEEAAADGQPVLTAVARAAATAGRRIGAAARAATDVSSAASSVSAVAGVLAAHGYEPRVQPARVVLANCPFHALAERHTELVCRMNLELITALTDELGGTDVEVRLDPGPDRCCVTLQSRAPTT